jgi:hypothetical protein
MPLLTLPLRPSHLENLRQSGIRDYTIAENRLHSEGDFLAFPYLNLAGHHTGFARLRPDHPQLDAKGRPMKYIQKAGTPPRAYFPWLSIQRLRRKKYFEVFIVEGEKKALALSQDGDLVVIGLGGVWNGLKKGSTELIADLQQVDWSGVTVYLCFDYDQKEKTRHEVDQAKARLASALLAAGATVVLSVNLPPGPLGTKQGVDDYLLAHGMPQFMALVDQATPVSASSNSFNSSGGKNREYSNLFNCVRPPELGAAAYTGFVGDFLRAVGPLTEATDAAILLHLLAGSGVFFGNSTYVFAGDRQPPRINGVLFGPTARGRKGTAWGPVRELLRRRDAKFADEQITSGLSSGEGLIAAVSDKRTKNDDGGEEIEVKDKRLLVIEPEFAKVAKQTERTGNILSPILRESYDSGNLSVLTKNPLHARDAHIGIVGHSTPGELKAAFPAIEMANGFGNRFLWFATLSDKDMPFVEPIPEDVLEAFVSRPGFTSFRERQGRFDLDQEAKKQWQAVYSSLRCERPGMVGAMTARGESIVLRVALIYALLDNAADIRVEHLNAALAVWNYNVKSVEILFGDKSGNSLADNLLRLLSAGPTRLTELHAHTSAPAAEIRKNLEQLEAAGLIRKAIVKGPGAGRPAEVWQRA